MRSARKVFGIVWDSWVCEVLCIDSSNWDSSIFELKPCMYHLNGMCDVFSVWQWDRIVETWLVLTVQWLLTRLQVPEVRKDRISYRKFWLSLASPVSLSIYHHFFGIHATFKLHNRVEMKVYEKYFLKSIDFLSQHWPPLPWRYTFETSFF